MLISVNQKSLEKSLDIASNAVAKKVINPALQGILFSISDSVLNIQSSDGEVFLSVQDTLTTNDGNSRFLVKGALRDIVRTLPSNGDVTIEEAGNFIKIQTTASQRKTQLNLLSLEDFADFPDSTPQKVFLSINALEFKEMLGKTLPFVAKEEIRMTFNSLLIQKEGPEFRIISSDTKRLAFVKCLLSEDTEDFSILIPAKTGQILKEMIVSQDVLEISRNKDNLIVFKYKNIILISPEVDGIFPDYRAVIPKETPVMINVDKSSFADTLKGFQPFYSSSEMSRCLIKATNNLLTLTTEDTPIGVDENYLEVEYSGEDFTVAFSYRYLLDILQHIPESHIQIKLHRVDKPVIFCGKDNQNALFVCIPMRI